MARENQGLQIALIVFVILSIALGVATFMVSKEYGEAVAKAEMNEQDAQRQRSAASRIQDENNELKRLMGFPATATLDEITDQFKKHMAEYAGSYPEEARFYSTVLPYLYKTIEDKLSEIDANKTEIFTLNEKYKVREAGKDLQIEQFRTAVEDANQDRDKVTADFKSRRDSILSDQQGIKTRLDQTRKKSNNAINKIEEKLGETAERLKKAVEDNREQAEKIANIRKETFEVPDGEVRWIDQRNRTVWINLGRSDALSRQITFSVYPAGVSDVPGSGKKASIEVTQILGPHRAEARILNDSISDPIMPGDRIFTPVWSPGEQKRFALAGLIDVDGNGKSDLQLIRNLITMNGGVIDSQMDDAGKISGEMSINTRYLVLGKELVELGPNKKNHQQISEAYTRMVGNAKRLGIAMISVDELLRQMGWKHAPPRSLTDAGSDESTTAEDESDSRAAAGEGFRERRPPALPRNGSGSAY